MEDDRNTDDVTDTPDATAGPSLADPAEAAPDAAREEGSPVPVEGEREAAFADPAEAAPDAAREPDAGPDPDAAPEVSLDEFLPRADAAAPAPESSAEGAAAGMPSGRVSAELKATIEALIFASPDPITPRALFKLLESEPREDVEASLAALSADYDAGRGLHLVEVAGGYQITTRPELHEWVRRLFHERRTQKLSVQALETLAVIAYKQPITAPEIAEIRSVNTSGVLATLLERHLIKIAGRKQVVGRPFLYATTREFLIRFGLRDINDLPRIEDMADVLGFEPPAGLAGAETTALLPLEMEPIAQGPTPTVADPPADPAGAEAGPAEGGEPHAG